MNIREQVKELRTIAEAYRRPPYGREIIGTEEALSKAADTIEALSAKLQGANMKQTAVDGFQWKKSFQGPMIIY